MNSQLLMSGVVAALVSSLFSLITTILTLRAQWATERRKRSLDRYDRLYTKVRAAKDKISQTPIPGPKTTDFEGIKEAWVTLTQTLKIWYDAYDSCAELFDQDIRDRIVRAAKAYDDAYRAFHSDRGAEGATTKVLDAARTAIEVIPAAANEQLERLTKF